MTPRNTNHGASASARRAPAIRATRSAPSARTRKSTTTSSGAELKAVPAPTRGKAASGRRAASSAPRPAPKPRPRDKAERDRRPKPARREADASVVWRWWLLPILVVAVGAIFGFTYYPVAKVQYRETREKSILEAQLKGLQARNQRLQTSVDRLKTPEGVEDYARTQLGMVKAGEHVVVVVDGTQPASSPPATGLPPLTPAKLDSEESVVPTAGPWTHFLDAFFGVQ